MRFFNQINDSNIVQLYNTIDISYFEDFWVLFNISKLFNKISEGKIEELICGDHFDPFTVFCHQKIVQKYGSVFKKYIINNKSAISIVLHVLRDLYKNEVISKWHYPLNTYDIIQDMIDEGILNAKSSLLSTPEVNYFNYLLNHSEYSNGLEIRNKYSHGVQHVNINEDEHRKNYFWFLIVFITLAIKINDDFCLKDSITELRRIGS